MCIPGILLLREKRAKIFLATKVYSLAPHILWGGKELTWDLRIGATPSLFFSIDFLNTLVSQKVARFSKIKNILDLLSDEKEGKIKENIDFSYFSNRASFMGNPVENFQDRGFFWIRIWSNVNIRLDQDLVDIRQDPNP